MELTLNLTTEQVIDFLQQIPQRRKLRYLRRLQNRRTPNMLSK